MDSASELRARKPAAVVREVRTPDNELRPFTPPSFTVSSRFRAGTLHLPIR
jgi:hypothetical protein